MKNEGFNTKWQHLQHVKFDVEPPPLYLSEVHLWYSEAMDDFAKSRGFSNE